eukprot:TRINITY_DN8197_c0_g1_i1.p1 TRINITY_DN8197_c0_g1~~TRINITY_DN8197_c0_g1_i1.p1  ORF type:complete len:473 (-),score=167.40 TRINITY_DN8197_c0_g1_i1:233-1651(-)
MSITLREVQKVKMEIARGLVQRLHDNNEHHKQCSVVMRELEQKVDELERVLGRKKMKAIALIKRRIFQFLLRSRLKALATHHGGIKKRIADCATRQHVLLEVVSAEERFLEDLGHLESGFLQPIRDKFLAVEVGSELDPHGWVLQTFDLFMGAVGQLRHGHAKGLPKLKTALESEAGDDDRLRQICKFYSLVDQETLTPLVKYMNRMSAVMKMLADRRSSKGSAKQGKKVKDYIWKLQHQLPGDAAKLSLESYIFGVLQNSVSSQMMLERLRKLTPEEHVSMAKLIKASSIITQMNERADARCTEFLALQKMHDSLYEPKENLVDESRTLIYEGCVYTLGRLKGSESVKIEADSDLNALLADAETSSRLKEHCHLFLLTDVVLLCEPMQLEVPNPKYRRRGKLPPTITATKFSVKRHLRRSQHSQDCRVTAHDGGLFSVVSETQGVFLFKAESEEQQKQWVTQFRLAWTHEE